MRMELSPNKKDVILDVAIQLFLEQGYYKSTMRQIAAEADVSLGLVVYHFGTKRTMALTYLQKQLVNLRSYIVKYIDSENDPVLHACVLIRLNQQILSSPYYLSFYKDMLEEDIFLEALMNSGSETAEKINQKRGLHYTAADTKFFGNYVAPSVERALMMFPHADGLSLDIPDIIFKAYMFFLVPDMEELDAYCRRGKEIVDKIIAENPVLLKPYQ